MPTVLQRRHVPDEVASLTPMSYDYVDLFTIDAPASSDPPEQWARTAIERVAGRGGQFVWRVILGLRLRRRAENIGGWKVADEGDDWLRLEASSWFLTAHLVIKTDADHLSVATFIRYDRPAAGPVWRRLSAFHRAAMPGLLIRAWRLVDEHR